MTKFKKYYLIWFIVFGGITLSGLILNYSKLDAKYLLFAITTSLAIPLLLGRLIDWTENVWTPKKRKKFYNKEPLINLLNIGFTNIEDKYFKGTFNKYNIVIEYNHTFQRLLHYSFYYKPNSFDSKEFKRVSKLLKNENIDIIAPGHILFSKEIKFKLPKYEVIESDLIKICSIMKEKNLEPISILELDKLLIQAQ